METSGTASCGPMLWIYTRQAFWLLVEGSSHTHRALSGATNCLRYWLTCLQRAHLSGIMDVVEGGLVTRSLADWGDTVALAGASPTVPACRTPLQHFLLVDRDEKSSCLGAIHALAPRTTLPRAAPETSRFELGVGNLG